MCYRHYKKFSLLLVLLITALPFIYSQPNNTAKGYYKKQMLQLQEAIQNNFYDPSSGFYKETVVVEKGKNPYSYLWPLCGMVQANNEIEKVTKQNGLVFKTLDVIQQYYDTALPAPGYASYIMKFKGGDRFYDDNQWIGIASMDAISLINGAGNGTRFF